MSNQSPSRPVSPRPFHGRWDLALIWSGRIWFSLAAIGQLAFISFIILFYGTRTFGGDWVGWNDRPIITGHVTGDGVGNLMFAAHVLIAAIVTLGGLLQLLPHLRKRFPVFHRWNGRIFIGLSCCLALGGLWMTWGRGSYLSIPTALGVSLNGILILAFSGAAIAFARARDFKRHEGWAIRTFMVVSGVWFFRVGLMGWVIVNQGPRGMTETLSGPADIALSFGSYLIPLLGYELYRIAESSHSAILKAFALLIVSALTLFMVIGIVGAILFMWFPT